MVVEAERGSDNVVVQAGQVYDQPRRTVVWSRNCKEAGQKTRLNRNWDHHPFGDPVQDGFPEIRLPLGRGRETKSRRVGRPRPVKTPPNGGRR